VTLRLIPRRNRAKQTVPPALLLVLVVLAGCGGGGGKPAAEQGVSGPGYRFAAPAGWTVKRSRLTVAASQDAARFVAVSTFPLLKPYRAALFGPVEAELRDRMDTIAKNAGGTVAPAGSAVVGGVRSHVYRLDDGDHVDEYTFVLVGRREFQLVCRAAKAGDAACRRLQASFRLKS
jgi:hypothetical protein